MKHILAGFLSFILLASCSSKYGIVKAEAYSRKIIGGTIKVDRNGNPANSGISQQYLIYVETDTLKPFPEWKTVWVDQQAYSARPAEINSNQVIGKTMEGQDVVLNARPGNRIWQLVLSPYKDSIATESSLRRKIEKYPVVITGVWHNKPFAYKISREKQLQSVDMQ